MASDENKKAVELDPTLDFFAGTVAGMAALSVGYPFDTVKVRFQNPSVSGKYNQSTFHALATIVREERFLGLFKGITAPLASAALLNGLVFASYRFFIKLQLHHDGEIPTLTQIGLAGAGCGVVGSLLTTPVEFLKIQQQQSLIPVPFRRLATPAVTASTTPKAPSALAIALQTLRERGIRGLYRGITATALRDTGFGAYFIGYEAALRVFSPPIGSSAGEALETDPVLTEVSKTLALSPVPFLLAGGVAGVAGWAFTFPFDVIKTRIQSSGDGALPPAPKPVLPTSSPYPPRNHHNSSVPVSASQPPLFPADDRPYRNTLSTIAHSYRTEGSRVFVRGLAPTLIRAVPVNMVTFATFESIVHAFS
ncbi:mitochondrial carrier protein [Heterobasidion irregulare TC 32-1]|uniref:Mitochondrial carrier protein n=1 Tax=Heterobasidion irregulare (strain TC 32-1) TaxID=747525 RepID=W4JZ73_HETIT|nr:mitochondrial carrier protein [Heterobasidion irregulare TC 32-1]ETW78837.1 mitochondrial carrier protein [Heterobasidion irregulare TC 32-1]